MSRVHTFFRSKILGSGLIHHFTWVVIIWFMTDELFALRHKMTSTKCLHENLCKDFARLHGHGVAKLSSAAMTKLRFYSLLAIQIVLVIPSWIYNSLSITICSALSIFITSSSIAKQIASAASGKESEMWVVHQILRDIGGCREMKYSAGGPRVISVSPLQYRCVSTSPNQNGKL